MKKRLLMVATLFASLIGTSFAFTNNAPIYKEIEERPAEFTDDTKAPMSELITPTMMSLFLLH